MFTIIPPPDLSAGSTSNINVAEANNMANHPNRNWRARMNNAADQWLAQWPMERPVPRRPITDEELRILLRAAYLAGYEDGRRRDQS